jgi:hypothetical protein
MYNSQLFKLPVTYIHIDVMDMQPLVYSEVEQPVLTQRYLSVVQYRMSNRFNIEF